MSRQGQGSGYNKNVYYIPGLDVTERILAALYVSIMGVTRYYVTTFHLCIYYSARSLETLYVPF